MSAIQRDRLTDALRRAAIKADGPHREPWFTEETLTRTFLKANWNEPTLDSVPLIALCSPTNVLRLLALVDAVRALPRRLMSDETIDRRVGDVFSALAALDREESDTPIRDSVQIGKWTKP